MPEIKLRDQIIPYTIRYSKRARYVNFRMKKDIGLEVVIPDGLVIPNLEDILRERQDWILKYQRIWEGVNAQEKKKLRFVSGEKLLYMGEEYELLIKTGYPAPILQRFDTKTIEVTIPEGSQSKVPQKLYDWYVHQAKYHIVPRAIELSQEYDLYFNLIHIRNQRTRWGSCSSKGNLNFNWRLIMTPPDVIDYIIIHELCHLVELNHSPRFWKLVKHYCPDYKAHERWLKNFRPPF